VKWLPLPLLRIVLAFGDVAGWLGHAQAARSTSLTYQEKR
jgi:hypothetical protein